jgi:threonine dehydratase
MPPTPQYAWPLLKARTGVDVVLKHENHTPTGAFKVRGGIVYADRLKRERPHVKGVITATRGNHGQSLAFACPRAGVACTVVVPFGNSAEKNAAMKAFGAELIEHGRDFDEARERVEQMQHERKLRYVHSANEPLLIAGVGTYGLEIFEQMPDVDVILVPIGGGSGACGCAIARTGLGSRAKVIGIQAERADAVTRSWKTGTRVVGEKADTFAEGMATRVTFDLTFDILKREVDDILTLTEDEIAEGIRLALRTTHNLAEGAGSASLAAAMKIRDRLAGQKVVCVMSGGNIDRATLQRVLATT